MALKLFKKHCDICKKEVDKKSAEVNSGKYFCSREHLEECSKKLDTESPKNTEGGGCCGR